MNYFGETTSILLELSFHSRASERREVEGSPEDILDQVVKCFSVKMISVDEDGPHDSRE